MTDTVLLLDLNFVVYMYVFFRYSLINKYFILIRLAQLWLCLLTYTTGTVFDACKNLKLNFYENLLAGWFRYSFISQGTSTRRQRSDLFGLRVKKVGVCLT